MSSTSGGKYTRELKLRVLEHYFRNGGDVFGNKQATAKKFGVDSKTINRFLKIHELVRSARRKAKAGGKSAAGPSGAFKEPLVPGTSSRQRTAAKPGVRITMPDEPDEAIVNQTADGNLSSVGKLLKIFELGTQEIRELLLSECELVYECRVCRGLFRSLANLLTHKRRFCTRPHVDTRQVFGCGPGQSLSAPSDGVLVLPLPAAVERLPEVRQAAAAQTRAAAAQPVPTVRLEPVAGTAAAVFQTVGDADRTVGERLAEVRQLQEAAGRTVRLGRNGRIVQSDDDEQADEADMEAEPERHVCQYCNTTFSTRKTLSHHVRSMHSSTRIYYPCSICSAAFIDLFSVERHLQKVHRKKQDEIEELKEGIKAKSFQRAINEAHLTPGATVKTTSFEWKCRHCSRRYLSLPVGVQHVQSLHPQVAPARSGLVRVCRVLRQPVDAGAVSTRSSSGAVTPAADEDEDDADDDGDDATDGRMLFNKANLLKQLSNGSERCVLCRKVFTGHLQACGHLRLHDQSQIETYLGQKVRLIRKRRPDMAPLPDEEYELGEPSAAMPGDEDEDESDDEPPAELASVQARGFPVHLVPAEGVRRTDFIYADDSGDLVCTLCEARFDGVKAVRAHMARHGMGEVRQYVARHSVDGMVGVPAISSAPAPVRRQAVDDDDDGGDAASVDTDVEAGAKLLVSCKLWSPRRKKVNEGADEYEDESVVDEDDDECANDNEPLAKEMDGEVVDKWEAIRRKGERLRCVVCNKTFMKSSYAETHLRTDHSFEEIRDFVSTWRFKGIRVPPRSDHKADDDVDDENDGSASADVDSSPSAEAVVHAGMAPRTGKPPPAPTPSSARPSQGAMKRPADVAAAIIPAPKVAKRDPNAPAAKPTTLAPKVGTIGPNTKILKISRSDLLTRLDGGLCLCLVCGGEFATHVAACGHMRQHSDADIRNFIKTRGREFLPAFEKKSKMYRPRVVSLPGAVPGSGQMQGKVTTAGHQGGGMMAASASTAAAVAPNKAAVSSTAGAGNNTVATMTNTSAATQSSKAADAAPERLNVANDDNDRKAEDDSPQGRTNTAREVEWLDKAQLLRRGKDSTTCLLCLRVFAKHSSACGHVSHHGAAEVRSWRRLLRRKADAVPSDSRRASVGTADGGANSVERADPVGNAEVETKLETAAEPPEISGKTADPDAISAKATDNVDKPTRTADNAAKSATGTDGVKSAKTVNTTKSARTAADARKSGKTTDDSTKSSGAAAESSLVNTSAHLVTPPANYKLAKKSANVSDVSDSVPVLAKAEENLPTPVEPAAAGDTLEYVVESKVKRVGATGDVTSPPANVPVAVPKPRTAAAGLPLARLTVTTAAQPSPPTLTATSIPGVLIKRSESVVKSLQTVKLAVLQTPADGSLMGRTIMRLAPGVRLPLAPGVRLPLAATLPRPLRPIAPKVADGTPVVGPQPPALVGGSPRPPPPPLMRAPLLQTVGSAGRTTIQISTPKTTSLGGGGAVLTNPVPSSAAGSRPTPPQPPLPPPPTPSQPPAAQPDARLTEPPPHKLAGTALSDGQPKLKVDSENAVDAVQSPRRSAEAKADPVKSPPAEKRPDSKTEPRHCQRKPAADRSDRPERAAQSKPDTKASTPVARAPVVTKRAFIPDVRPMRCWTPDTGAKPSARAAADDSGEVPQTRARVEAAMAARVRQTRRSSGTASADRK